MVKRLLNKLGNLGRGLKKTFLLATVGLMFYGCPMPSTPEPEYTTTTTPTTTTTTSTPTTTTTSMPDYVDISGKLEDNENDGVGREGVILVYDTKNLDGSFSDLLAIKGTGRHEFQTSPNGNFSFTLDKLVNSDPNDKIYVRTITGTLSNPTSYTRTIELPAMDHNPITDPRGNPAIRPTPFNSDLDGDGFADIDFNKDGIVSQQEKEDFKTFIEQINSTYAGVRGFDLSQIQGVEILRGDPLGGGFDFNSDDQTFLKNKIDDPNDIGVYVEKKDLNGLNPGWIDIQIDNNNPGEDPTNKKYEINGGRIEPYLGWIVVAPKNISGGKTSFFWDFDLGKIKRARIDLGVVNDSVPTHEFGHVFIASNPLTNGHSTILPNPLTIMTADNLKSPPPGVADEKGAKMIYENTYQFGEALDNI